MARLRRRACGLDRGNRMRRAFEEAHHGGAVGAVEVDRASDLERRAERQGPRVTPATPLHDAQSEEQGECGPAVVPEIGMVELGEAVGKKREE